MLDKVAQTIEQHNLLKPNDKIVLGISGGPDSVCLLDLLLKLEYDAVLAHVNYNLREKDSIEDEKYVRELAEKYGVKVYVKDVKGLNLDDKGLEENAREIRYDFFNEIMKKENASKIAVAHNKDDNAETIMLFFMRGAGLRGLTGIKHKKGKVIRPMLDCFKKDVLDYLKKNDIKYRMDKTNLESMYTRNKIRNDLIPMIEKDFNPNFRNTVVNNSALLFDDYDYIEKQARNRIKDLKCNENCLKLDGFLQLDVALQRTVLRLALEKLKDISSLELEETRKMLTGAKTGSCRKVKGIMICKDHDVIRITNYKLQITNLVEKVALNIPGETRISALNSTLETEKVDKVVKVSNNEIYVDLEKAGEELFARTRKDGDRIYLNGLRGSQKLKDFFINNKVSKFDRDSVLLIVNGEDKIVWIAGMRGDRRFEAGKNSRNIISVSLVD